MNDDVLRELMLDEVPDRPDGWFERIDQMAGVNEAPTHGIADSHDDAVIDISLREPTPTRPRFRRRVLFIAAAVALLAGVLALALPGLDDDGILGTAEQPTDGPSGEIQPRMNLDHWHAIYGVWDCTANDGAGDWVPAFQSSNDELGIHSHGDGLIHIHPFFEQSAGENAVFGHFLNEMQVTLNENSLTLDDGRVLDETMRCGSEPVVIHLRRWALDFQALEGEPPARIVTTDIVDERFLNDREVWVLAVAPLHAEIPLPPDDRFDTMGNVTAEVPPAGLEGLLPLPTPE